MKRRSLVIIFLTTLLAAAGFAWQSELASVDPSYLQLLHWRMVGPSRGGRVTAVAGDYTNKQVFYFGATGGGIWKTDDGGINWHNVSDGFVNTGSVGAVAVAPSDSNIVYAGMGEACVRGNACRKGLVSWRLAGSDMGNLPLSSNDGVNRETIPRVYGPNVATGKRCRPRERGQETLEPRTEEDLKRCICRSRRRVGRCEFSARLFKYRLFLCRNSGSRARCTILCATRCGRH